MLSVVIATNESEHALVPTLAALVPGAAAGAVREVIIADAGSRDQTADVADIAGCRFLVLSGDAGSRLRAAAATARSKWLMFLRPGIVLDANWIEETIRFVETAERGDAQATAAVFRPTPAVGTTRAPLTEAFALLRIALGGRPRPEQGLVIPKALYAEFGGHRAEVVDPEAELIRSLGRRRIVMLRSGATATRAAGTI